MEKTEEQYQTILINFPETSIIDNTISHVRIPLINEVFLEIDFKNYPKKPKVNLIKPDGQVYKKLDEMVLALRTWKKENAPAIVDLVTEIFNFIKRMETQEILIKQELLDGILGLCRQQHPREILGLLRTEKGIVSEYILPPGSVRSESSGVFFPSRVPVDPSLEGSVHSHPTGNPYPSAEDLVFFVKLSFHFIVGYPYNLNKVKCFDRNGRELQFKIVP